MPNADQDGATTDQETQQVAQEKQKHLGAPTAAPRQPWLVRILGPNAKQALIRSLLIALGSTLFIASAALNLFYAMQPATGSAAGSGWLWTVTMVLLALVALSLGLNFWLYYVRNIHTEHGPALVPEKWGVYLNAVGVKVDDHTKRTSGALTELNRSVATQTERSDAVLESFLTLQNVISKREEEIERLKRGHDTMVFKRFLAKFIRVSAAIDEVKEAHADSQDHTYLARLMRSALEDCGVEPWVPDVGSDYRQAGAEVADEPHEIETDDEALDWTIAAVDAVGYVVEGPETHDVITPARVTIYRSTAKASTGGSTHG